MAPRNSSLASVKACQGKSLLASHGGRVSPGIFWSQVFRWSIYTGSFCCCCCCCCCCIFSISQLRFFPPFVFLHIQSSITEKGVFFFCIFSVSPLRFSCSFCLSSYTELLHYNQVRSLRNITCLPWEASETWVMIYQVCTPVSQQASQVYTTYCRQIQFSFFSCHSVANYFGVRFQMNTPIYEPVFTSM